MAVNAALKHQHGGEQAQKRKGLAVPGRFKESASGRVPPGRKAGIGFDC